MVVDESSLRCGNRGAWFLTDDSLEQRTKRCHARRDDVRQRPSRRVVESLGLAAAVVEVEVLNVVTSEVQLVSIAAICIMTPPHDPKCRTMTEIYTTVIKFILHFVLPMESPLRLSLMSLLPISSHCTILMRHGFIISCLILAGTVIT